MGDFFVTELWHRGLPPHIGSVGPRTRLPALAPDFHRSRVWHQDEAEGVATEGIFRHPQSAVAYWCRVKVTGLSLVRVKRLAAHLVVDTAEAVLLTIVELLELFEGRRLVRDALPVQELGQVRVPSRQCRNSWQFRARLFLSQCYRGCLPHPIRGVLGPLSDMPGLVAALDVNSIAGA